MRRARHTRVEQQNIEIGKRKRKIQGAVAVGIGLLRKGGPHRGACVMVAGNERERNFERREQLPQVPILLRQAGIDQIARDDDHGVRSLEVVALHVSDYYRPTGRLAINGGS